MKKLNIVFMIIASVAVMSSCTSGSVPKANLKTDMDSLSYAVGVARSEGLYDYLLQMGIDSAQMKDFVKGFLEGATVKAESKKNAYIIGLGIGQQVGVNMFDALNQQLLGEGAAESMDKNTFLAGFLAAPFDQKNLKMDIFEAQAYTEAKAQEIQARQMEALYGGNRDAGVKFLEDNKRNSDVTVLESGLQYKVITQGRGRIPTAENMVRVNYHGTLIDGTVFDSSVDRGAPAEFYVTGVIQGWVEALQLMPVGSKWILYIPQELAYRSDNMGTIQPFSTLIFEVELLDIVR
jgi:FKBP-type peptidyl-prolyl cis-trans isomerase FklB